MAPSTIEQLTSEDYATGADSLTLEEIRHRRALCQSAEEGLSLQRRLVQGRLDIVQAELYRRAGNGNAAEVQDLVAELPSILVEHGDRHLGPGRLTSLGRDEAPLGADFDALNESLNAIVAPQQLSELSAVAVDQLRTMADDLDQLERSLSTQRHGLHKNIDRFQEEIVRRYKTGQASVDTLLQSSD